MAITNAPPAPKTQSLKEVFLSGLAGLYRRQYGADKTKEEIDQKSAEMALSRR